MSVKFYKCQYCGNIVMMLEDSGVVPSCCEESMELLVPQTTDTMVDKHLPLTCCDKKNIVHVYVGKDPHPMTVEHHLSFIVLETTKGIQVHYLEAGELPKVDFKVCDENKPVAVYSYCNLHGLWAKEVNCKSDSNDKVECGQKEGCEDKEDCAENDGCAPKQKCHI